MKFLIRGIATTPYQRIVEADCDKDAIEKYIIQMTRSLPQGTQIEIESVTEQANTKQSGKRYFLVKSDCPGKARTPKTKLFRYCEDARTYLRQLHCYFWKDLVRAHPLTDIDDSFEYIQDGILCSSSMVSLPVPPVKAKRFFILEHKGGDFPDSIFADEESAKSVLRKEIEEHGGEVCDDGTSFRFLSPANVCVTLTKVPLLTNFTSGKIF